MKLVWKDGQMGRFIFAILLDNIYEHFIFIGPRKVPLPLKSFIGTRLVFYGPIYGLGHLLH